MKFSIFKNEADLHELVLTMRDASRGEPTKARKMVMFQMLIIGVQCCLYLLHYITRNAGVVFKLSTFDLFGLKDFPPIVQLEMIGLHLAMMRFCYVIYFKAYSMDFFGVIEQVLVHQDHSFTFHHIPRNIKSAVLVVMNAYEMLILFLSKFN